MSDSGKTEGDKNERKKPQVEFRRGYLALKRINKVKRIGFVAVTTSG